MSLRPPYLKFTGSFESPLLYFHACTRKQIPILTARLPCQETNTPKPPELNVKDVDALAKFLVSSKSGLLTILLSQLLATAFPSHDKIFSVQPHCRVTQSHPAHSNI